LIWWVWCWFVLERMAMVMWVSRSVTWKHFQTSLLFSVGGLSYVVVSWFFSRFHPFEFPSVHPFFLRRENLEFMQYWMIFGTWNWEIRIWVYFAGIWGLIWILDWIESIGQNQTENMLWMGLIELVQFNWTELIGVKQMGLKWNYN